MTIIIHGGAGNIIRARLTPEIEAAYRQKLTEAVQAGQQILQQGDSSSQAVIAAIQVLEDSALFNAGHGAVLNNQGYAELDASIMEGADLNAGAVAGVTHIKNPILLAARVLGHSPHVFLAGAGAEEFARAEGFELVDNEYFTTQRRRLQLQRVQQSLAGSADGLGMNEDEADPFDDPGIENPGIEKTEPAGDDSHEDDRPLGTVGAVAIDQKNNISAGTSTGGLTNKQFGRVGDAPMIGAGTYADNHVGGISASGHGEYFIRVAVASDICARVRYQGVSFQQAADDLIKGKLVRMGGYGGVIGIDRHAEPMVSYNSLGMYRASINRAGKLEVAIFDD